MRALGRAALNLEMKYNCSDPADSGPQIDNNQWNIKYPQNSSYEARCLTWGATRKVDDGILVVESWLMSATEYIAIDNTLLRAGVHVHGRLICWSRQVQEPTNFVLLIFAKTKHWLHTFCTCCSRVNQVIYTCIAWISAMTVWKLSTAACPVVAFDALMHFYDSVMSTKRNKSNSDGTFNRVHTDVSDSSSSSRKSSNSVKKSKVISSKNWSKFLIISSIEDGA